MDSRELAILGICVTILLAIGIPVFIYYRKKHFVGGFLTVDFKFSNGLSMPKAVVKPFVDENGDAIRDKSIVRHHITWTYKLTITNNSSELVLFPRITHNENLFPNIELGKIDELKPIGIGESKTVDLTFFEISDTLPTERKNTSKPPEDFKMLKLRLEYYNNQQSKFYTLYDNSDKSNQSYKLKPDF